MGLPEPQGIITTQLQESTLISTQVMHLMGLDQLTLYI